MRADLACRAAGVHFAFTGAEGIRRKYQQRSLAQLVVAVTRTGEGCATGSAGSSEPSRDRAEKDADTTRHDKHSGSSPAVQQQNLPAQSLARTAGEKGNVQEDSKVVTAAPDGTEIQLSTRAETVAQPGK